MTHEQYEAIKGDLIRKTRALRFQYTSRPELIAYRTDMVEDATLFDFGGVEHRQCTWLIDAAKEMTHAAIEEIVIENLKERGNGFSAIPKDKISPCAFGFVLNNGGNNFLVLFKEFGMDHSITNRERIRELREEYHAKEYYYFSFVEDYAYLEKIDHNDNPNDPSRGTRLFSIKFFFEKFFGSDEAQRFLDFAKSLYADIDSCLGMRTIKTLSPYALFGFKFVVEQRLKDHLVTVSPVYSYDLAKRVSLSPEEIKTLKQKIDVSSRFHAIVGTNDFAKSFITAEWLHDSLLGSGTIDYSSIIMGYCKAVEQLLFSIVGFHVDEGRRIKQANARKEDRIEFTSDALSKKQCDISYGPLVFFLKENRDLFCSELTADGQEYILCCLRKINSKRNGLFHKKNCYQWFDVEDTKALVYNAICFLLGGIEYAISQERNLGIGLRADDQYIELCEYIHCHSNRFFYIKETAESEMTLRISVLDPEFFCNKDGKPTYSGVYFLIPVTKEIKKYPRENAPYEVRIANFELSPTGPKISEPKDILWENGKFICPGQVERIDF